MTATSDGTLRPTIYPVSPLPTDIDWDQVESILGIKIARSSGSFVSEARIKARAELPCCCHASSQREIERLLGEIVDRTKPQVFTGTVTLG